MVAKIDALNKTKHIKVARQDALRLVDRWPFYTFILMFKFRHEMEEILAALKTTKQSFFHHSVLHTKEAAKPF